VTVNLNPQQRITSDENVKLRADAGQPYDQGPA
jgi:hypothetical protein